jgi:hypothetical protein
MLTSIAERTIRRSGKERSRRASEEESDFIDFDEVWNFFCPAPWANILSDRS